MRILKQVSILLVGALLAFGAPLCASAEDVGGFMNIAFVSTSINPDTAYYEGMGERGYGLDLNFGVAAKLFVAGIGGQGEWVKDRDQFSVDTTGGTFSSQCNIYGFTVFVGLRSPALNMGDTSALRVGANAGRLFMNGKRSTSTPGYTTCIDCPSESLEIDGGVYIEPYIAIESGSKRFYIAYRKFGESSDAQSALLVGVGFSSQ